MAKRRKPAGKAPARKVAKKVAKKKVAAIPAGFHTMTPYIVCRNAGRAIDFYKRAFGAKERLRMDAPNGTIAHAELQIGDSIFMLGDEMPQMGATAPETVGGTASGLLIYHKDVDKAFAQAIAAGAKSEMAPMDMFWGDRYCKLLDPFGHKWSIATHIEDLSPKEMARRSQEAMKQASGQAS